MTTTNNPACRIYYCTDEPYTTATNILASAMVGKVRINVQSFPRPPKLEKTPRRLQIKWDGHLVADTADAYWVLETHHPPTYYIPRSAVTLPLATTSRRSWCEWKGAATYYAITSPDGKHKVLNRIWSYETPAGGFEPLKDHLSFYAGPWDCFVDGEKVDAQPGDFYGGWVTSEIEGIIKGHDGNRDPAI